MLLVWCRLAGGVGEKKRAEGAPLLTSRPDRRSDARRLGGSDRAPKVAIRRHALTLRRSARWVKNSPPIWHAETPKTPTASHQAHRLDDCRDPLIRRFLARNRCFLEKVAPLSPVCAAARAIWRDASHVPVFDEKGRRFRRLVGPSGVGLDSTGVNPVAPRTKGLALIHIVFYFSTSPSFGVEYGQAARRAGQSGGPEHGSKEEAQGRCEA